ncbi:MAG: hypothetical protein EBS24_08840 [Chitinophagia bacterium]|nr:hypothetical protein [Chitinophagia bacterium]
MDKELEMWLDQKKSKDVWDSANRKEERHQDLDIFDEWESEDDSLGEFKNMINRLSKSGVDEV